MKLLTVKQPWAALIALGHKPLENRTWQTAYRGDVGIIAGRLVETSSARAVAAFLKHIMGDEKMPWNDAKYHINNLPRGGVVCVVELYDVKRHVDSWWYTGPQALMLRNARPTSRVVKAKGSLVLAQCPPDLEAEIMEAVNAY